MKKPELLSPAGNMESLYAAIEGGCDAVYLSGVLYGARSFAANFTNEQLEEAVTYAHLYGVKVYVTVNTLIYEAEVKNFLNYVEFLQSISVDAVIIQDIGMMDLLRQVYPSLEIHASTQMHIHNMEGVKLAQELGIKRVVLARETPVELIKQIKESTSIELEIFVHGALCISYSGQCLMSSLIGGRSGNRGTCAQCCRQPYELMVDDKIQNKDNYLLSTKDLNTLTHISELIDIGVDSLKIEGRMKRPEYVYLITSLYRKAIDSYAEKGKIESSLEELEEMKKIFHRGFTKGFLFHEDNHQFTNEYRPNHMGIPIGMVTERKKNTIVIKLTQDISVGDGIRVLGKKMDYGKEIDAIYYEKEKLKKATKKMVVEIPFKEDVLVGSLVVKTTDKEQLLSLQDKIAQKRRKIFLQFSFHAKANHPMTLEITDGKNTILVESDFLVQESKNSPISKERIDQQLKKLGGTVYDIDTISYEIDDNIFVSVQKINELRREGIEKISEFRLSKKRVIKGEYFKELPDFPILREKSIYVTNLEEYETIKNKNYDEIYVDENIYSKIPDKQVTVKLPRVQENVKKVDGLVLVGELGSLYKNNHVVTDFSFNVVNSYSIAFLHSMGARKVTLSYELNDYQIEKMIQAYRNRYGKNPCLEIIVSGKIEAMVMKYNLLKKYQLDNKKVYLIDKYHNRYPVISKDNLCYIYHYQNQKLENPNHYYDLGISSLRDSF